MSKRSLCLAFFLSVGLFTGCTQKTYLDEKHIENLQTTNQQLITSGELYEITENNFIDGLQHDFTDEELILWNQVFQNYDFQEKDKELDDATIKYTIRLYNKDNKQVGEYMLDADGFLFNSKGKQITNKKIEKLLKNIISSQ